MRKTRLKPMSDKRRKEARIYSKLRKEFLEEHPYCQVNFGWCSGDATDIHHREGRYKNFLNVDTYVASCRSCHSALHRNPRLARKLGYLK